MSSPEPGIFGGGMAAKPFTLRRKKGSRPRERLLWSRPKQRCRLAVLPSPLVEDHALRAALVAHFAAAGYLRREPAVLQPASDFFDSGEEMRGRLYLTSDASGAEYCLRPEYTVPVCRHYLASGDAGRIATYAYCGPVFRFRPDAPGEFIQAGIENIGRRDLEAADAEVLAIAVEAVVAVGHPLPHLHIGDAALLPTLLNLLDLPPQWRRRIIRGHADGKPLPAILDPNGHAAGADHSGVLAALEGADKKGARELVEDLLSIAGISTVGGRTAAEIADRFLEQASLRAGRGIADDRREIVTRFLAIEGDPDSASTTMRRLAADAKLDMAATLDRFDARLGFMAARGLDIGAIRFATRSARNLDYYTGFVFEGHHPERPAFGPLLGGGRYDTLLRRLGAPKDVPAVGASIWVDGLASPDEGHA